LNQKGINENKDEEDKDTAEKNKKLGIAGTIFLFVIAALVIGIPVLEIIRAMSKLAKVG